MASQSPPGHKNDVSAFHRSSPPQAGTFCECESVGASLMGSSRVFFTLVGLTLLTRPTLQLNQVCCSPS